MIVENKTKNIVDVINKIRADKKNFANMPDPRQLIVVENDKGVVYGARAVISWKTICTIDELDCEIEELAAAKWMNGGLPQSYSHEKDWCISHGVDTSSKVLQMSHLSMLKSLIQVGVKTHKIYASSSVFNMELLGQGVTITLPNKMLEELDLECVGNETLDLNKPLNVEIG